MPLIIISFLLLFLPYEILYSKDQYFLTLRNDKVNLRQGPSFDYPVKIFYKKKFLPVLIQQTDDTQTYHIQDIILIEHQILVTDLQGNV